MKKLLQFTWIPIVISLLVNNSLLAGGWSSGGGELLKNSRNPWFLNNVKDVYYCIKIDEEKFGVSRQTVKETLLKAIEFWKSEFQFSIPIGKSKLGEIQLASQTFKEVTCSNDIDIAFQFGTLTQYQKKYLQDPTKYGAITVRTSYSNKSLKGKGFVYVSPEKGPLAFNPEGLIKKAWSLNNNILLYQTLVHELGHIFGIPHMGSLGDLMSETFVESLLINQDYKIKKDSNKDYEIRFFSLAQKSVTICPEKPLIEYWRQAFDLLTEDKCLQFMFQHDPKNQLFGTSEIHVMAGADSDTTTNPMHEVASTKLVMYRFNPTFMSLIWLTEEQTLFDQESLLKVGTPSVLGVSLTEVAKSGIYKGNDSKKRTLNIRFEQGRRGFRLDCVLNSGTVIPIL